MLFVKVLNQETLDTHIFVIKTHVIYTWNAVGPWTLMPPHTCNFCAISRWRCSHNSFRKGRCSSSMIQRYFIYPYSDLLNIIFKKLNTFFKLFKPTMFHQRKDNWKNWNSCVLGTIHIFVVHIFISSKMFSNCTRV